MKETPCIRVYVAARSERQRWIREAMGPRLRGTVINTRTKRWREEEGSKDGGIEMENGRSRALDVAAY